MPIQPAARSAAQAACDKVINRAASSGQRVFRESEVATPAELIFENRGPRYPGTREPASGGAAPTPPEAATVRSVFVVDSTGHADVTTFQSIEPVPDKFLRSVQAYLPTARFKPARIAEGAVAQCVVQSFVFTPY